MMLAMFDLLSAKTVRQRMSELSKFIEWWYGPHKAAYAMKDVPQRLPLPLQRFYKRHGLRPSLNGFEVEFFYEGGGLHHLFQPKHLEFDRKSRVKFFMEYQGDFNSLFRSPSEMTYRE